ncbi:ScyD/ScyE family protein [Janibacter melonis]|uniref:ScyD/ScyE family protein n=1 Tax=Janibacter melonis TaxID=262209 RepID=UPI00191B571B|nr:ScyD/ScyE family protein [Janibacter melonis]
MSSSRLRARHQHPGRRRGLRPVLAAAAAAVLGLSLAPPTSAARPPGGPEGHPRWVSTIDDSVLAPFQLAVEGRDVYATDGFLGTLTRYSRSGTKTVLARVEGGEIAGVDVAKGGRTWAYASTSSDGRSLLTIQSRGRADVVADLGAYEQTVNPDQGVTYGIIAGGNPCAEEVFGGLTGGQATYTGIVESHPYAVAALPDGSWAVADAAGNSVLRVDRRGRISTLALAPRRPLLITQEIATSIGLPDCTVGVTYAFEGVPTDVEVGPRGRLYMSSLPGGPEDPSLGARGAVFTIGRHGAVTKVASGFLGATNLAVQGDTLYVAELFGGQVTAVHGRHRWAAYRMERPLAVEVSGRTMYLGQLADIDFETGTPRAPGSIVKVSLRHHHHHHH